MKFEAKDFWNFNKMLTPLFIQILFYILLIGVIISGVGLILSGINAYVGGGVMVFSGLATVLIGPFLVRLTCESLIVLFKIHDRLSSIDEKTK